MDRREKTCDVGHQKRGAVGKGDTIGDMPRPSAVGDTPRSSGAVGGRICGIDASGSGARVAPSPPPLLPQTSLGARGASALDAEKRRGREPSGTHPAATRRTVGDGEPSGTHPAENRRGHTPQQPTPENRRGHTPQREPSGTHPAERTVGDTPRSNLRCGETSGTRTVGDTPRSTPRSNPPREDCGGLTPLTHPVNLRSTSNRVDSLPNWEGVVQGTGKRCRRVNPGSNSLCQQFLGGDGFVGRYLIGPTREVLGLSPSPGRTAVA